MDEELDIIKTDEVAEMMGVSIPYFYFLRKKGKTPPPLPTYSRPRYSRRVVEIWLNIQKEKTKLETLEAIQNQKKELQHA